MYENEGLENELFNNSENVANQVMQDTSFESEESIKQSESQEIHKENRKKFCPNCGQEIGGNQKFCSNCGRLIEEEKKKYCVGCGAEIEANLKFCPNCGRKTVTSVDISVSPSIGNGINRMKEFISYNKKKVIIVATTLIALIVISFGMRMVAPNIFASTDKLMEQGEYEKAYSKADGDEKEEILIENAMAYICKEEVIPNLKDPSSFQLVEGWFDKNQDCFVLNVSGKNGYGGAASSYWYITYSSKEKKYDLFVSLSTLKEESYSKYDDSDEKIEKLLKNASREIVGKIIDAKKNKIEKESISRINSAFENDTLDNIELLDDVSLFHKNKKSDEDDV